ncbi:MAG: type II secretion system F family protein [Actinomycetaceae bacterium]|nr:type II secretion system F family protein [Actinomycetaceae bacterium]
MSGAIVGLVFATGVAMLWSWYLSGCPSLMARVSRYLDGQSTGNQSVVATVKQSLQGMLASAGSTNASVEKRLQLAGGWQQLSQFRLSQLYWALAGSALGVGFGVLAMYFRGIPALVATVGPIAGLIMGPLARDRHLSAQARNYQRKLATQVPDATELIALAVGAGEGLSGAIERVTKVAGGPIGRQLSAVHHDVRAGIPMQRALQKMAGKNANPPLSRLVNTLVTAIDRGTPLAPVLRAQALDSREQARKALMEEGGKREIAMLVPVVFLLLPQVVLFAMYPGLVALKFM